MRQTPVLAWPEVLEPPSKLGLSEAGLCVPTLGRDEPAADTRAIVAAIARGERVAVPVALGVRDADVGEALGIDGRVPHQLVQPAVDKAERPKS